MVTVRSTHNAQPPDDPGRVNPLQQQLSDSIAAGFAVVLKDVRAIHREMVAAHRDMVRGSEQAARQMDAAARVGRSSGSAAPARHVGREAAEAGAALHAAASVPEPPISTARGSDVYDNARDVGALRKRVGSRIASTAQNTLVKPGQGMYQDDSGEWYRQGTVQFNPTSGRWHRKDGSFASAEEVAAHRVVNTPGFERNAAGRWINSATGKFAKAGDVRAASTGWGDVANFQNRMRISNTIGAATEAFGSGQPVGRALLSLLPEGLAKGAGYAGLAYSAINKGYEFAQGQYAKNRRYQEYLGGSNTDQFGERISAFTNNLRGRFSLLGADNYNQLFQGSTEIGERGRTREETIRTGASIMGGGASMEQTMRIIEIARGAGQSLEGLAKSISGVNKVAREAGVSAKEARDVFIQNYRVISSMMGLAGGQGAAGAASSIASAVASQGEAYKGTDYTGTYGTNIQYYLAAKQGMSYPQFALAQTRNPGLYQAAVGSSVQQLLDRLTPQGKRSIRQIVESYLSSRGGEYVAEVDNAAIFQLILKEGYQPILIRQALERFGISTPDEKTALATAVQMFTNQSAGARSVASQAATEAKYARPTQTGLAGSKDIRLGATMVEGDGGNKNAASRDLFSAYIKTVDGKNKQARYPVVEELLRRTRDGSLSPGAKVLVQTGNGGRVVSLKDAITKFPDQLQNGTATLLDDDLNQSVGDYLGLPATVTDATASASASTKTNVGQSEADWRKSQSKDSKSSSKSDAKVTIDLTDEVKRFFKVMTQSGTQTTVGSSSWDGSSGTLPGAKNP